MELNNTATTSAPVGAAPFEYATPAEAQVAARALVQRAQALAEAAADFTCDSAGRLVCLAQPILERVSQILVRDNLFEAGLALDELYDVESAFEGAVAIDTNNVRRHVIAAALEACERAVTALDRLDWPTLPRAH
jgi:hypothetical protein